METLIKVLDESLDMENYEVIDGDIVFHVKSNRLEAKCPYCSSISNKVHSRYHREFKDLPILDKKTRIVLNTRKFFCKNSSCGYKTFAEFFEFIAFKAKKTRRLEEYILNISQNTSSLAAKKLLSKDAVQISKSSICNLIKKRNSNRQGFNNQNMYR